MTPRQVQAIHTLAALHHAGKRREVARFEALINTPADFNNPLQLPGSGRIYASMGANTIAPVVVFTANGLDVYAPPTHANEMIPMGYFEKDVTLEAVYGASSINLYLGAPLGERALIASKS